MNNIYDDRRTFLKLDFSKTKKIKNNNNHKSVVQQLQVPDLLRLHLLDDVSHVVSIWFSEALFLIIKPKKFFVVATHIWRQKWCLFARSNANIGGRIPARYTTRLIRAFKPSCFLVRFRHQVACAQFQLRLFLRIIVVQHEIQWY